MQSLRMTMQPTNWGYQPTVKVVPSYGSHKPFNQMSCLVHSREKRILNETPNNNCILSNYDTDFLDDQILISLALTLGVNEHVDLPDLRVVINDLR